MRNAALVIVALVGLLWIPSSSAGPSITLQSHVTNQLSLEIGQTRLMRISEEIVRVSVANPDVADVQVVTPLQVLVTAKGIGYTHLILWSKRDEPLVIAVSAVRNLEGLRQQIKELFPGENIQVSSSGELVVLSGKVKDLRLPSRLAEVAKMHATQLANLVEVTGDQQVQLEVHFVEMSRTGMREMGVNAFFRDSKGANVGELFSPGTAVGTHLATQSQYIPGTAMNGTSPPLVPFPEFETAFNLIFSTATANFSAILSIMSQNGMAKVLAEPTLVALSGQEASFHAGGELPIVLASQLGSMSVEFKKFGIRLKFQPTVLGDRTINLKVYAEVSEPDPTIGVTLTGFNIPGLKMRNSDTTVRLKDGQSFAIAGLLSDNMRTVVKKIPGLGDIPILGALFRSTGYQREETELLVVVKTHLVQPLMPNETPVMLGTDEINDPDDFSLFLLGRIDAGKKKKKTDTASVTPSRLEKPRESSEEPVPEKSDGKGGPAGPLGFISR